MLHFYFNKKEQGRDQRFAKSELQRINLTDTADETSS